MRRLAGWILVGLATATAAGAAEPAPPASALFQNFSPSPKEPVAIHSDHLQVEMGTHHVLFTGHVVAQQGERVIYADRVEATYTEAGELTKLFARGNVKMTAADTLATGDELELDNAAATITLRGHPRVVQARQVIRGREMVFHLKEKRLDISEPRIEWMPAETPKPAETQHERTP